MINIDTSSIDNDIFDCITIIDIQEYNQSNNFPQMTSYLLTT